MVSWVPENPFLENKVLNQVFQDSIDTPTKMSLFLPLIHFDCVKLYDRV